MKRKCPRAYAGRAGAQEKIRHAAQAILDEMHNSCNPRRAVVVAVRRTQYKGYPSYIIWRADEQQVQLCDPPNCLSLRMIIGADEMSEKVTELYGTPGEATGNE